MTAWRTFQIRKEWIVYYYYYYYYYSTGTCKLKYSINVQIKNQQQGIIAPTTSALTARNLSLCKQERINRWMHYMWMHYMCTIFRSITAAYIFTRIINEKLVCLLMDEEFSE